QKNLADISTMQGKTAVLLTELHAGDIGAVAKLFFFSSRGRHTRWPRDWSSDVCSSDLPTRLSHPRSPRAPDVVHGLLAGEAARRSEERRVGKECRSGWSANH